MHRVVRGRTVPYGEVLMALGRLDEADDHLLSGYRVMSETLGPDHRRTRHAADQIRLLYDRWGRPDKKSAWESAESTN
jgi:hypothetical protein